MTHPNSKPVRGNKGRSAAFQRYLDQQTPERARELVKEEMAYLKTKISPVGGADPQTGRYWDAANSDYHESFYGYEDTPAGTEYTGGHSNDELTVRNVFKQDT